MVKKISYILIAVAITATGFIGLKKLNYLERSVWIFKLDNSGQNFEGRGGRGRGERPDMRNRNIPDSLRREQFRRNDREQMAAPAFERGHRDGGGRGEFGGGKKIYLKNIYWFTAAFALFTVIMIYLDRAFCFVFKRHNKQMQ